MKPQQLVKQMQELLATAALTYSAVLELASDPSDTSSVAAQELLESLEADAGWLRRKVQNDHAGPQAKRGGV